MKYVNAAEDANFVISAIVSFSSRKTIVAKQYYSIDHGEEVQAMVYFVNKYASTIKPGIEITINEVIDGQIIGR